MIIVHLGGREPNRDPKDINVLKNWMKGLHALLGEFGDLLAQTPQGNLNYKNDDIKKINEVMEIIERTVSRLPKG